MGLAPSMSGMAVVICAADGACPLFRAKSRVPCPREHRDSKPVVMYAKRSFGELGPQAGAWGPVKRILS